MPLIGVARQAASPSRTPWPADHVGIGIWAVDVELARFVEVVEYESRHPPGVATAGAQTVRAASMSMCW
jgi:hypothetical protein